MSNFLARMLDRTFRSSDAVRPVIKSVFATEVIPGDGHSLTPSLDESNGYLPKKGESTGYAGSDAFARDSDLPSEPREADKRALPSESMHSNRAAENQIVSRRGSLIEIEKAGSGQNLSSAEKGAWYVSGLPGKPGNHNNSQPEGNMEQIVSEQVGASQTNGLSREHSMDRLRPSYGLGAEPESTLIQKKAAIDNSFNSHIDVTGKVLKEGGISEISDLSGKHDRSKTRSRNVKLRSEQLFKSFSPTEDLKGANTEGLLIPSDSRSYSHPEASSDLKQKGLSIEKGTSFGESDSSTAPTVKVTIGRIEVRAVMQQAYLPRRRTATTQPRLSLADYLKRRDGGLR